MIYSRGPRPKALVSDVLCKISGILNHFNQFKSLGGPQGLRDIFIEYIEYYSRGLRTKTLVSDVLCKTSGILNHFNQFKTLGGPQGGQRKAPQGSHDIFKGPMAKSFGS